MFLHDETDGPMDIGRPLRQKLPPPPLEPAEVQLDAFDVEMFARRLMAGIPTLRDGVVSVDGARGAGRRVATIGRDDGEMVRERVRYAVCER